MIPPPNLTPAAFEHLAGRPLVVRTSVRHGCCGGQASLAVAEVGPPASTEGYRQIDVRGVTVHLDRRLDAPDDQWTGDWTVAVDGLGPWRRLVVLEGNHSD